MGGETGGAAAGSCFAFPFVFFLGPFWWSRLFLLPSLSESGGVYPSSLKWGSGAAEGEEQRKREIQIPQ